MKKNVKGAALFIRKDRRRLLAMLAALALLVNMNLPLLTAMAQEVEITAAAEQSREPADSQETG